MCVWVCLCVTPNRSLCCHATQGEVFVTFPRTDSQNGCNILATLFWDIPEVCKPYLPTETKWLLARLLTAAFALRKSQSKFCIARASNKANRRFLVSMVPFFFAYTSRLLVVIFRTFAPYSWSERVDFHHCITLTCITEEMHERSRLT